MFRNTYIRATFLNKENKLLKNVTIPASTLLTQVQGSGM